MRTAVFAAMFACVLMTCMSEATANAEPTALLSTSKVNESLQVALLDTKEEPKSSAPAAPVVVSHTVAGGEHLSVIAEKYGTTWKRIYDKNTQITHPDLINVGDVVVIPNADEQLAERALPTPPPAPVRTETEAAGVSQGTRSAPQQTVSRGSVAGNTYTPGYCTWYAKNMRPDLPNNLGNADTWVARAAAQGLPTGSAPRAGAIGQQGMHVVYVQSVNGDGTVTISEMNFKGLYTVSSRTVPASSFTYIY